MAGNVTTMVIKVDLGCEKCRKKIKKVLCKIPQIKNQIYDEKTNTVTITVGCGCPEKVKEKIRCKAGDIILGIEIKAPEKPPEPKKPEPQKEQKKPDPPKDPPKNPQPIPCCWECYQVYGWGPGYWGPRMPPPCYGSGGCSGIYVSRCSDYVCEENPTAPCRIM